ncbi:MAG: FkbM family methyltransferase [Pseudomonadota bacterium]
MSNKGILKNKTIYVIDVGASGGLHSRWPKIAGSNFKAVLFEPDPREYDRLKQSVGDNYIVLNSALSDFPKDLKFNLCRKQQVSSIFMPNFELLSKYPEAERHDIVNTITMKTDTMDSQLRKAGLLEVDFIKIDTQGYELSILEGAVKTLENVIGLEVEVEFLPIYKDQPLFPEIDQFITSRGFELIDLKRYYWRRNNTHHYGPGQKGQIIFGDALYFKTPENICSDKNVNEDKILRAVTVYLAYEYFDLAEVLLNLSSKIGILSKEMHVHIKQYLKNNEKFVLRNFKGKGRIEIIFRKISNLFTIDSWASGCDEKIGNF